MSECKHEYRIPYNLHCRSYCTGCDKRECDVLRAEVEEQRKDTLYSMYLLAEKQSEIERFRAEIERLKAASDHMALCRAIAGVPDDETLAVWIEHLKAEFDRLRGMLREIHNEDSIWGRQLNKICQSYDYGINPPCGKCLSCRIRKELGETK